MGHGCGRLGEEWLIGHNGRREPDFKALTIYFRVERMVPLRWEREWASQAQKVNSKLLSINI